MEKQVAVLIDGDNISSKYAEYIKQEASQYGNVRIFRLYGAINCPTVKQWYKIMPGKGIMPMLQICYANGKSVADQALTIDAMDMLHAQNVNVFCIVSSDSDFTKLVYRIKESGCIVIGMGEQKTKESLANACDEFKILDLIYKRETEELEDVSDDLDVCEEAAVIEHEAENNDSDVEEAEISIPTEDEVINAILDLLDADLSDEKKMHLSNVGFKLSRKWPGFDARNYGYKNMKQLLNSHNSILAVNEEKAPDGIHSISYVSKR